jgi:hypothetical protein
MCSWHCKMAIINIVQGLKNADWTEKTECCSHVEYNIIWYCRTVGRPLWSSICEAGACDQFSTKCVHFWDCTIFAMGCSYFSFLPYLVGIYLKLSFTGEWVIVFMWVYTEIIVSLTMHSHIICTLVLKDLFQLWWLISKYFCTLLYIPVICPNYFEQS